MDANSNSLNWFEIPVTDLPRSKAFYETVFDISMGDMEMEGMQSAMFPWSPGTGKANGSLTKSEMHTPSMEGTVVYLNADPNMDPVLERVEAAGGKVLMPKTPIGEHGFMAFIQGTEGNKVGIHSNG